MNRPPAAAVLAPVASAAAAHDSSGAMEEYCYAEVAPWAFRMGRHVLSDDPDELWPRYRCQHAITRIDPVGNLSIGASTMGGDGKSVERQRSLTG